MAVIRKFMFDTDFDEHPSERPARAEKQPSEPAPEPEPPPPTFSEEELNEAREEAYDAGRLAGIREAEAATGRLAAQAIQVVGGRLQELGRVLHEEAEARHRDSVRVAMAVAARVLPDLAQRNALGEVEELFRTCMGYLLEEPRVTVRLHDAMAEAAGERLEEIARHAGFEGRLQIIPDTAVPPGDCKVEWSEGGAERNMARLWQEIEAVLDRALGPGSLDVPSEV